MTLQLFPVTICETWKKTIPIISASREAAREELLRKIKSGCMYCDEDDYVGTDICVGEPQELAADTVMVLIPDSGDSEPNWHKPGGLRVTGVISASGSIPHSGPVQ